MTKRHKVGTADQVEDFRVDTFLEAIAGVYKTYDLVLITPTSDNPIVHELCDEDIPGLQDAAIGSDVELCVPVAAVT